MLCLILSDDTALGGLTEGLWQEQENLSYDITGASQSILNVRLLVESRFAKGSDVY